MNEDMLMLQESAARLFAARVTREMLDGAERGGWPEALWRECWELGYLQPVEPQEFWQPGEAATLEYALLSIAGYHALPLPIAEAQLAGGLLCAAGGDMPQGLTALALDTPPRAPWGRQATQLLLLRDGELVLLEAGDCRLQQQSNLAGEPRDLVTLVWPQAGRRYALEQAAVRVRERAALMRAAQMSGAIQRCLELAVAYAGERKQFGRPIGAFQAIQHQLALMAGQAAMAKMAVLSAYDVLARVGSGPQAGFAAAIAKSRAGEAAGIACSIAHQVHGAMGFTHEHPLQFHTRRLQSWRAEYGTEGAWNQYIGEQLVARGADLLWPLLTETA